VRPLGYCPRCNSKARHRRWWLFLQQNTNLFTDKLRLLHVAPNYCMSRRFSKLPNIDYVGVDYNNHRNICIKMDLPAAPLRSNSFDALICMHVLEHIPEDRQAMRELYRVLKPGGWAGISAPIRLDQKTYEDPSITSPQERERAFGETVHVRYYGYDLVDRLEEAGFQVKMYPGREVDAADRQKYGLRDDENIFYCTKP
jgi:SAM-dependent methyltransferase